MPESTLLPSQGLRIRPLECYYILFFIFLFIFFTKTRRLDVPVDLKSCVNIFHFYTNKCSGHRSAILGNFARKFVLNLFSHLVYIVIVTWTHMVLKIIVTLCRLASSAPPSPTIVKKYFNSLTKKPGIKMNAMHGFALVAQRRSWQPLLSASPC